MTTALEQVFEMASKFSEEEQRILANHWLREIRTPDFIEIIRDEMKWEKSFSETQDVLEKMADRALEEIREGKAEQVGWDEL